jgi:ABC-type glycerol-3-phosphate transport system permease component
MHRRSWSRVLQHIAVHGYLGLLCLVVLFPIAWVVLLSVKSLPDAYTNRIWPQQFDFSHYGYVFTHIRTLPHNITNSILVTLGTILISIVCATLAGYALVFQSPPGSKVTFMLLVSSLYFPTRITALIAIYEIQKRLGLLNTAYGLIFPYVALSTALSVFIMRGIFLTIPRELADAARIDGCGPWRLLLYVMLPLVRNGMITVGLVNFVTAWGEYLLGTTLTNDQDVRTLPVVLAGATGGMGQWAWPRIAAVYVITITPAIIVFAIAQRWLIRGIQEGALRG